MDEVERDLADSRQRYETVLKGVAGILKGDLETARDMAAFAEEFGAAHTCSTLARGQDVLGLDISTTQIMRLRPLIADLVDIAHNIDALLAQRDQRLSETSSDLPQVLHAFGRDIQADAPAHHVPTRHAPQFTHEAPKREHTRRHERD